MGREAILKVHTRKIKLAANADLHKVADRIMLGLEKKNRVMSAAEKERVAITRLGTRSLPFL